MFAQGCDPDSSQVLLMLLHVSNILCIGMQMCVIPVNTHADVYNTLHIGMQMCTTIFTYACRCVQHPLHMHAVVCELFAQTCRCVQGEGPAASLPPTLDPNIMLAQGFDQDGMLRLVGKSVPAGLTPGVVPAQFWAAGFSFSRAQLIMEVMTVP